MAPLLDVDHVVGERDPDLGGWIARDWTPGPAGTATVGLAGGVELEVDVASPATLVGLWVPSPLPRRGAAAVARLLGEDRAAELLALGTDGRPGGPVVLGPGRVRRLGPPRNRWPGGDDVDGDDGGPGEAADRLAGRRRTTGWTGPGSARRRGVAPALARAGLATAASAAASPDPLVRGLGHVDAAVARLEAGRGVGLGRAARAHALAGAELLLDLLRRGELDGRTVDPAGLAAALGRLEPVLPARLVPALRALRHDLASGAVDLAPLPWHHPAAGPGGEAVDRAAPLALEAALPPPAAAPAAAPRAPAARAGAPARPRAVGRLVPIDRGGLPLALERRGLLARTTTPSEVEVRAAGAALEGGRWWARALEPDGSIVAAAPLLDAGEDLLARLLVPPERLAGLTVDVTDRPGEARPSPAALGVLDAVGLGQAAARAERVGDTAAAAARWHRSAAAWDAAGVGQRAGLARELAAGRRGGRVPPPLLADPVLEEADGA